MNDKGFSLLEGIVVVGIVAVMAIVVVGQVVYSQNISQRSLNISRATALATEAIEAVRDIRNADFFDLNNGAYGLVLNDGRWSLAGGPDITDNFFQREITITSPSADRRLVEAAIVWPPQTGGPPAGGEVKLATEFRNWFPTFEDWRNPQYDGQFDLTPANSGSNNHKVRTVKERGNYLFVGNDNSAGKEFLIFDLVASPTINIKGTADLDGDPNNISIFGNYAFIVSDHNTEELQIVNIGNLAAPAMIRSIDLSGNDDALTGDINSGGNLLAVGRISGNFYVFDISDPSVAYVQSQLTLPNSPDINSLKVSGGNVFIAAGDGTLRVVSITNPSLPAQTASLSLGCSKALSIDLLGNRAYIGCAGSAVAQELFLVDITNPSSPLLLSSANIGDQHASVNHLSFAASDQLLFLLTGDTSADFQVWNVANDLSPVLYSSFNISGFPSQADYSPLVQRMFIGLISNPELQVIAPDIIEQPPS